MFRKLPSSCVRSTVSSSSHGLIARRAATMSIASMNTSNAMARAGPSSCVATTMVASVRFASCGSCGMSGFTDVKYNTAAEEWLDDTCDVMDGLCEDFPTISDVSNVGGVLTIDLGDELGTFILNKQAPKRQLWLSSPISGPSHYDMVTDEASGRVWWRCDKTGADMSRLLEKEFASLLKGATIALP